VPSDNSRSAADDNQAPEALRVLYFIRDAYPTARADVLTLFGDKLLARGVQSDIVALRRPDLTAVAGCWPAGQEFTVDGSGSALGRALLSLLFDLRMLSRARHYDVVVVRDKIVTAALACLLIDARRLCYWMSFPFTDEDRMRAAMPGRSPLYRAVLRGRGRVTQWLLDGIVVPRAARVFVQSERMQQVVARRTGRHRGLIAVPMGVDERRLSADRPVRRLPGADGTVVLGYLGLLDRVRRIEFLLDVLRWLSVHGSGRAFRLVLVGGASTNEEFDALRRTVEDMRLSPSVTMTGPLPMDQAWQRMETVHIGLSAIPRGDVFDVSSPTKAVEYIALGLPVVVNDIPDQALLIEQTGAGLCAPMDIDAFGRAILDAVDRYDEYATRAKASRQWILDQRTYWRLSERVNEALRQVASQAPRPAGPG
jgi:glycosyltransferase involved in cell wall biosynthesis